MKYGPILLLDEYSARTKVEDSGPFGTRLDPGKHGGEGGRKFKPARRRCFSAMARHPLPLRFIAARRAEAQAKAGGGEGGIPNLDNRSRQKPRKIWRSKRPSVVCVPLPCTTKLGPQGGFLAMLGAFVVPTPRCWTISAGPRRLKARRGWTTGRRVAPTLTSTQYFLAMHSDQVSREIQPNSGD
jgi:hypothetical protein